MDKKEELKQWFSLAEQDLSIAKNSTITMHPIPVERICNLCQQSAEKDLKGYLFFNDVEFPKTHNLIDLLNMCAQIHTDFENFVRKCQFLTNFAVLPRYPNELQITEDDAKTAIRFAEDIKDFCQKLVI
ncbi:MAG: HEPN domain-containing protein [Marinilabiliaceae bacterium]|nr:HEPN domain-containing protein [Marinilabiliaceae bacterium]